MVQFYTGDKAAQDGTFERKISQSFLVFKSALLLVAVIINQWTLVEPEK